MARLYSGDKLFAASHNTTDYADSITLHCTCILSAEFAAAHDFYAHATSAAVRTACINCLLAMDKLRNGLRNGFAHCSKNFMMPAVS